MKSYFISDLCSPNEPNKRVFRTPQSLRDSSSFSQRGALKLLLCCYIIEYQLYKQSVGAFSNSSVTS